jgi:Uma2 family endonuclease
VSVICRPNAPSDSFQDDPAVIVEVLSRKTRRIDEGEKKDAYLSISSLSAYVLLEQDAAAAVVYRRSTEGFSREIYTGLEATIQLDAVGVELPFTEVYDSVEFIAEPETDD